MDDSVGMQTCRLSRSEVVCVNWHTPAMRQGCRVEGIVKMQLTKEGNSKTVIIGPRISLAEDSWSTQPTSIQANRWKERGMKLGVNDSSY